MEKITENLLKRWKNSLSKLSQPITPKSPFFSQEAAQLVFIFIFFLILNDTASFFEFSHTFLGHVSVVFVLIYFTLIHPMAGAILSMMVILYYHTDLVKAYYYDAILYKNAPSTLQEQFGGNILQPLAEYIEPQNTPNSKKENLQNMEASRLSSAYPFTTELETNSSKYNPLFRPAFFNELKLREGFESANEPQKLDSKTSSNFSHYQATYEQDMNSKTPYSMRQTEIVHNTKYAEEEALMNAAFREKHCSINGDLMYKDSPIKPATAEHIFPELQIEGSQDGHACHPCNPNCKIHVSKIDQRLNSENILQKRNQPSLQKTSSDWVPTWFDIFLPHPVFQLYGPQANQSPFAAPANK
jgi:hypothetical protein